MASDRQIINYGTAPNDGTGDPLRDAFIKVDDNFANLWAAGPVNSNVAIANNSITITDTNGNLILKPNGIGVVQLNNSLVPRINGVYSIGTSSLSFRQGYFQDLTINGNLIGNLNLSNVGNITASGNVTAAYFIGDGSQLTGLPDTYTDSNVATFLANFGSNSISTTGNVSAGYFIGDGSLLSNLTIAAGSELVNGTSNVRVSQDSNVTISVSGVNDIAVFGSNGLTLLGDLIANALSGNGAALTSVLTDRGNDPSNWDVLTQMGVYKVNRTSWSGTIGTPISSQVFVGLLQVLQAADTLAQIFYPGTVEVGDAKVQWNRSYWDGVWTAWTKIVNNGQIIDAGSY